MLFEVLTLPTFQVSSLFVAILFFFNRWTKQTGTPKQLPGPAGLPWAGPVWQVDALSIYKTFRKWADTFGSIYQVQLFGETIVVVSDPEIAKELLAKRGAICSDRPSIALVQNSKAGGKYLPFLGNNDILHKQRKFGVLINNYTHANHYHHRVVPECKRWLKEMIQQKDDYTILMDKYCGRTSAWLAYGTPQPRAGLIRSAHNLMANLSPGGRITNALKFLKYLPEFMSEDKTNEATRIDLEARNWIGCYNEAKKRYATGQLPDCYARYFFDNKDKLGMTDEEAINGIGMMATVSVLTVTSPLQRWVAVIAQYPEWQAKIQKELEENVGYDRLAELSDSPNLPILRATILESMRLVSPIPTGIPHRLEEDTYWNGCLIKADTNIMACDWSMCHNPDVYANPGQFLPERWLSPEYSTYREPLTEFPKVQGHHTFGFGRRMCIGQDYAASELLISCAALMFAFTLHVKKDKWGQPLPVSTSDCTPHVIPMLESQPIEFILRSPEKGDMIRRMYEDVKEAQAIEMDGW